MKKSIIFFIIMPLILNGMEQQAPVAAPTASIDSAPTVQCPSPVEDSVTLVSVKEQLEDHDEGRFLQCPYCNYTARKQNTLNFHIYDKHQLGKQAWRAKGYHAAVVDAKRHAKSPCIRPQTTRCKYCPQTFATWHGRASHMKTHLQPFHITQFDPKSQFQAHDPLTYCPELDGPEASSPFIIGALAARIFLENLQTRVTAARKLLDERTAIQQPAQSLQPDERMSVNYLLNPMNQPVEQQRPDSISNTALQPEKRGIFS